MKINLTGFIFAGSVWLAAAVLAWPAHQPYFALGLLAVHVVLLLTL